MIKVAGGDFECIGPQKLLDVHSQVLKVTPEEYRDRMAKEAEKVCRAVMDHLIIEKTVEGPKIPALHPEGGLQSERIETTTTSYKAVLDTKLPPMSDVLKFMKEEK